MVWCSSVLIIQKKRLMHVKIIEDKYLNILTNQSRNIFKELNSDLNLGEPKTGDLTFWQEQGVVLLNRTLTCNKGESNSHLNMGWREITDKCAQVLSAQGSVAILWGKSAAELAHYFDEENLIMGVHPSPLSAYRGFFGSKPFSQANQKLLKIGKTPINWV